MRRLTRFVAWLLVAAVAVPILVPAGFRLAANLRETETPQAAAGADGRYVTADGLAIHYKQWGPDNGKPLILLPGSFAWSETFRDIAIPLGDKGWRVISPDMPPFGYSERPANQNYSRAAQARRLLAFADGLGLQRFALGVHSYGGGAAIEAALTAPQRIDSLILLDVALGLGRTEAPSPPVASLLQFEPIRNAVTASLFTNPLMLGKGLRDFIHDDAIVTPERIEIYARPKTVAGTTEAVGLWLFTGLYGDERNARSAKIGNYAAFTAPVLVIWGRQDAVTPLPQGEQIAKAFPNARLEVLDNVNHIPHVEKPAEVAALIDAFLASQAAKDVITAPGKGPRPSAQP